MKNYRFAIVLMLSMLSVLCSSMQAAERVMSAAIIPSMEWAYQEAATHKCRHPAEVLFNTQALGASAHYRATALVCGPIPTEQIVELLRTVQLAQVVSQVNEAWKLTLTGNQLSVAIELTPIHTCSNVLARNWILFYSNKTWRVIGEMPVPFGVCNPTVYSPNFEK